MIMKMKLQNLGWGVRIYYNDVLIDTLPAKYHENGHWETDYVFIHLGIHIFRVDLYDIAENGGVLMLHIHCYYA